MDEREYALGMQEEMIRRIEGSRPKFLVVVNNPYSWLPRPESEDLIFRWFVAYYDRHFRTVGVVDLISPELIEYRWDEEAADYTPLSSNYVWVGRRKA